jgi:hypothetical protein
MSKRPNAYVIIGIHGIVAAVFSRQHAEQLARDYDAVVCALPVEFDGRNWEAKLTFPIEGDEEG